MAVEAPSFIAPALEANADLSTKQFYFMKMTTTDFRIGTCDTDGEYCIGVLQNKPSAAGGAADVMVAGMTKVVAGETITAGDTVGTDSAGKCKKVEGTATGADTTDYVIGVAIEGAATDELASIHIGFGTFKVES